MRRANTTLIFLGSCLVFAEAALGTIAALTDVSPTLVAVFALLALGMVLAALVIMYWRDPAFLTLSGEQAHDLRRLEILDSDSSGSARKGSLPTIWQLTFRLRRAMRDWEANSKPHRSKMKR